MRVLLLSLLVALPGCLGQDVGEPAPGDDPPPDPSPAPYRECPFAEANATPAPSASVPTALCADWAPAPTLPVGRAWTYQATQTYDPDPEFTIVVAEAGPEGYFFAGGSEDDLVYHALWGSDWHGEHAPDLNAAMYEEQRTFDFPLVDGKSWRYREGLTLTARAAEVATPSGREHGFVVEGADERVRIRYEYAPSVGYFTSYLAEVEGKVHEELRLVRVQEGVMGWVWYELGPLVVVPQPQEAQAFDVPAGFDHVIASAGGVGPSRAFLAPPSGPGGAWQAEFGAEEAWSHAMLPAEEGKWVASVQGRPRLDAPVEPPASAPLGWAYMHAAPVKWVRHMP